MKVSTSPQSREPAHLLRGTKAGVAAALPAALLLALALALLPAAASAQAPAPRPTQSEPRSTVLSVSGPETAPVGNLARIVSVLRDGKGNPIVDARIIFTSPVIFAGTTGEMAIGQAWTDAKGVATLEYQLRAQGENRFIARFHGVGTDQPSEASTVVLATSEVQLVQRSAGVKVPVLGSWTIIVVLAGIWSTYFIAMALVAGIPQRQSQQLWSQSTSPETRFETGGHQ